MCSFKTMAKIALGIGLILVLGYVAFPQFQTAILALAPYLLVLACPLAMLFMMKGMRRQDQEKKPDQQEK